MTPLKCRTCRTRLGYRDTYVKAGDVILLGAQRWDKRSDGVWRKGRKRVRRIDPETPPPEHDKRLEEGHELWWDEEVEGPLWRIRVDAVIDCPECGSRDTHSPGRL